MAHPHTIRPTPGAQATACVCVAVANVFAQRQLVVGYGLRGSAYGTLLMRSIALVVLVPINLPLARRLTSTDDASEWRGVAPRLYASSLLASLLPVTLRVGSTYVLPLLALALGCGAVEAASIVVIALCVQTCVAVSMGIQQATLMLQARHLSRGHAALARRTTILAILLLLVLCAAVALVAAAAGRWLGAPFSSLADVQHLLRSLSWYIAPLVLLKATCGLAGQYLALSARGATSTAMLLVINWCVGIPLTYAWAARGAVQPSAAHTVIRLVQAHVAVWFACAVCFVACYLRPLDVCAALGGDGAIEGGVVAPLATPLLDDCEQPAGAPRC